MDLDEIDIGRGDLYLGDKFDYPYFFESPSRRMMEDPSFLNITFKTWKGEYFQFRLINYRVKSNCMILTSTLKDTFLFVGNEPTFSSSKNRAKMASENKISTKNSYSGYSCWGGYIINQLETLNKHLENQEIYFSDEATTAIYNELMRRSKLYDKEHRHSNTRFC